MIAIIDYNLGNVRSVLNATKRINFDAKITRDIEEIKSANGIILPGVGSFQVAMNNLKELNLIDVLKEQKEKKVPILGICLGMQILFEKGYEVEETEGLAFLKGEVNKIDTQKKLPHTGWNDLYFNQNNSITSKIKEHSDVYFVHSYMANAIDEEIIAYTIYGNQKIPAIVGKDNVIGCQFHPEKSSIVGKKILESWKEKIEC